MTSASNVVDSVPGESNKLQPWEVSSGTSVLQSDATGLLLIKNFIQINLCTLVLVYLSGGGKMKAQMTASNDLF